MASGPTKKTTTTDDIRQDLEGLSTSLNAILDGLAVTLPSDNQVWTIYAGAERNVARLKLRLGVERPGVFSELPTSRKPEELLVVALARMKDGIREMNQRNLLASLAALRDSRNHLRGYLAERRKVRMREKRQARAIRRPSPSAH